MFSSLWCCILCVSAFGRMCFTEFQVIYSWPGFFQTLSVNASIFTLTAIAVDRYKAIIYPLSNHASKQRTKVRYKQDDSQHIWSITQFYSMLKSVFFINTQSRFAGPHRLLWHTWWCPCFSVVPEPTHDRALRYHFFRYWYDTDTYQA